MLRFTDDNGIALGIYPDTIVCPPEMEIVFQKIVASTTYITATASGVANVWAGSIKTVIVDPWLTDVDDWYAFAVNMPLKPFVFQERQAPQFVALDKATDLPNFLRRKLLYSAESRSNAGYGFFQQGVKTVN
jgi:phage major head subunit gpT-like protein